MSVPRHEWDHNYLPVPDAPLASMLDVDALPDDVRAALLVCREFEAQGAVWPTLLADAPRAWFRYQDRAALNEEQP